MAEDILDLLDIAKAAVHRGQCHGSLCACDEQTRAAVEHFTSISQEED